MLAGAAGFGSSADLGSNGGVGNVDRYILGWLRPHMRTVEMGGASSGRSEEICHRSSAIHIDL